jgi:hypothetical protein
MYNSLRFVALLSSAHTAAPTFKLTLEPLHTQATMSDAAKPAATKPKAAKPAKPAQHPPFKKLVVAAIAELKEVRAVDRATTQQRLAKLAWPTFSLHEAMQTVMCTGNSQRPCQ